MIVRAGVVSAGVAAVEREAASVPRYPPLGGSALLLDRCRVSPHWCKDPRDGGMEVVMDHDHDADLLRRFSDHRDQVAFATLVERHGSLVLAACRRILGASQDADDAAQAAFLILARQASELDGQQPLAPWLYRVAINAALGLQRSARSRSRREGVAAGMRTATDEGQGTELPETMDRCLALLPERERSAMVLVYLQGLSSKDAARTLGCPEGTIASWLHRGRERLRVSLRRHGVVVPAAVLLSALTVLPGATLPEAFSASTAAAAASFMTTGAPTLGGSALLASRVLRHLRQIAILKTATVAALLVVVLLGLSHPWQGAAHAAQPLPSQADAADHAATLRQDLPLPPPAVTTFPIPSQDRWRIAISIESVNSSMAEIIETFNQVLRIPLRLDRSISHPELTSLTLRLQAMPCGDALKWMSQLWNLPVSRAADGAFIIGGPAVTGAPVIVEPPPPHFSDAPLTIIAHDEAPETLLRRLMQEDGHPSTRAMTIIDPRPLSLRLTLPGGLLRGDWVVATIGCGSPFDGMPFRRGLRQVVTTAFQRMPLAAALQRIAHDCGLPIRCDDESGPLPLVSRSADPIAVGDLLRELASAAGALVSEASDGMVLYRAPHLRFCDAQGQDLDAAGRPYAQTHAAWWLQREQLAAHPVVELVTALQDRELAVSWQECPLREVAADLQRRLGVAVRLPEEARMRDAPVLMNLPQRRLGDILHCLSYATGMGWETAADGQAIQVTPPSAVIMPSVPAQPLAPPAAPAAAPIGHGHLTSSF